MKKIKRISILSLIFMLFMSASVSASEPTENVGVSTEPPVYVEKENTEGEITIFGVGRPTADAYVDLKNGPLTFAGSAGGSTLYTNKHFKGKSQPNLDVWNYHSTKALTVKVYKRGNPLAVKTFTINPERGLLTPITGLNTNDLYYLSFSAPSNFSGKVY